MSLKPGVVEDLVERATASGGVIPCHKTTYGQAREGEAVCRGFFERHATGPLQLAELLGYVRFQEP